MFAQMPPGELLSRERMLAEIHATVRMPEPDRAAADALLVGLAQGRFVTTELVENVWHYRRSGKLPEEPKGPADNGPGSPGFNAVLLKAHEENQTRLDREMAAYTASHPDLERELLVKLIRTTIDERLSELGIETTNKELETA